MIENSFLEVPESLASWAATRTPNNDGLSPVTEYKGFIIWEAYGKVRLHTDNEYPRYSYAWVMKAEKNTVFRQKQVGELNVSVGSIFEVDAHIKHGLNQSDNGIFIWIAMDSADRKDIQLVKDKFSKIKTFKELTK